MFLEYLIIFFISISLFAFIYFSKMLVRHLKNKKKIEKINEFYGQINLGIIV